jgi:hypothetical protein
MGAEPAEPAARAFVEELLRTGIMLSDLLGDLLDVLAADAFPGENPGEVLVDMLVGTVLPGWATRQRSAYALEGYMLSHHSPTHTPRQLQLAAELVLVAERAGDKERLLHTHDERFDSLLELGDADGARAELEIMEALARELRTPATDWLVRTERAMMALLQGRFADAEVELAEAFEGGGRALGWNADVVTASSSTDCAANRAGCTRSRVSSAEPRTPTRPTGSGAACSRTWRQRWGTRPRRSRPLTRWPWTTSQRCRSTRNGW